MLNNFAGAALSQGVKALADVQLDRLKKAAIAFLQEQEIADRRLTALKRALGPITIPPST